MERQGDEVHVTTEEARSASTPNIVRYVLAISFFLAVVALSIIWITGAVNTTRSEGTVAGPVQPGNSGSPQ